MGRLSSESEKGPAKSTKKKRKRVSRSSSGSEGIDESDSEFDAPSQDGDSHFWTYDLQEMVTKQDFQHSNVYKCLTAKEFTLQYLRQNGLNKPILFSDPPAALGMKMPKSTKFSVQSVKNLIGGDRIIEVIEVNCQGSRQMTLTDFIKYYRSDPSKRTVLLNVLSLEFSMSPLGEKVLSPALVREIDWVELYWPPELRVVDDSDGDFQPPFPKVQHYCLMSVKDCFTDFHVDFGGTSVWYHILKGKKIFWMIEPTEQNLVLYEKWILEGNNHVFFGDIVEKCTRVELNEGNTFVIPSGWIHAVYTPDDSLVFGGNFLHSFSIPMQLRIRLSEDRIMVSKKYRYPFYNDMLWYVIEGFVKKATGQNFLKPIDPPKIRSKPSDNLRSKHSDETKMDETKIDETDQKSELGANDKLSGDRIPVGLEVECEEEPMHDEIDSNSGENVVKTVDVEKVNSESGTVSVELESAKTDEQQALSEDNKQEATATMSATDGNELQTSQVEDDSTVIKKTENESVVDSTETVQPSGDVSKHEEETSSEVAKEMPIDVEHKSEDSDSEDEEIDVVNDSGDEQINTLLKKCEENSNGNEELKFDDEYLASLCESERNGFRELLLYMRKNLRFRTKLQPSEAITDCDRLLITFEAVLNHEIDAQKLVEIQNKQKLAKDKEEAKLSSSAPQKPPRERKRKISVSAKKEKAPKVAKSKGRKSDPNHWHHFEGPLIVGGLPPAIMPTDAPKAPNPYGYDPLAAVTPLGHKQLPSAYRRTADMAKAPPAQRYRLQALRQHTESSSASDAGGTDTKLGPLEVDTSDMSAVASTSKSPLDSNNTVRKSSSGSGSSATKSPSGARHPVTKSLIGSATSGSSHSPKDAGSAHLNVRRRVSEPATSGAHGTTNRDGRNHHSQDDHPAASVTHHKSVACPELEYRSPLARTYPNQTSPSSTQKFDDVRLSSSSFGRRPITTIDRSQHHRRFTDHDTEGGGQSTGSRFRHNLDVGKGSSGWNDRRSSFEDQLAGGETNRGGGGGGGSGWHMPSQPPPWVPRNRRDHDSFRHPIPTIGSSIPSTASSSHQPYRYPPAHPNHHSRYPPPPQRGSQFNRRFENNRYPAPPPHYNTSSSGNTGGFNPPQKAPPLLPRPPFPPASHHAHSSSSPSSSSASQPFDAIAPHQTMQGTQEECVQYTEPSQQEPIPMDIEESPMNEDENEHMKQQSNSSDTQLQPQKSSTATAVGSHPETLSSNSAHHSKSHHDGNRAAAHQSHSAHDRHSAATGHGNRRSVDELARSRRRTTKTEDVTNGGYRPTPISDLPPRSDALLGIPVIQFERDPSVTGILKRRHAIAQQQQHASSTSLSSDSPGTPNTQLVDERLNAENSSRQLSSTPPQPSTSTTKEPLAASSHHHSIHDSSIVQKSQAGGADGSIPTTSTSTMSSALPSSSSAETGATAAKTNLERGGRRLCDATEQFPMAPPKLVEPKLITPLIEPKPIAKVLEPEPVDYLTAINELAKLVDEVKEEPMVKSVPPPAAPLHSRRNDSSTVLCDPRRPKHETNPAAEGSLTVPVEEQTEIGDARPSVEPAKSSIEPKVQPEERTQSALLEDLSFLTAEYNALD